MKRKASTTKYPMNKRYKLLDYSYKAPPDLQGARVVRAQKNEILLSRKTGKVELKVTQFAFQNQVSNAGTVFSLLQNMVQGTTPIDHYIGNEVLPTSVRLNLSITMGPLAGVGDGTNICRLVLFQWKDSLAPTVAGVLATSTSPQSMFYWNNIENMNVLSDKLYALHQNAASTGYDAICDKIYIKGKKMMPVKWNSITGNVQKGDIYALLISDSAVAPAPYFTLYTQVTYTDA